MVNLESVREVPHTSAVVAERPRNHYTLVASIHKTLRHVVDVHLNATQVRNEEIGGKRNAKALLAFELSLPHVLRKRVFERGRRAPLTQLVPRHLKTLALRQAYWLETLKLLLLVRSVRLSRGGQSAWALTLDHI